MRTTLTIDDDLLAVAKELAVMENRSVGEVFSALARAGAFCQAGKKDAQWGAAVAQDAGYLAG